MGITKRLMEDIQDDELNERIVEWVFNEYEIEDFDEGHPHWDDYRDRYFEEHQFESDEPDDTYWFEEFEAQWRSVDGKTPHELFLISMHESQALLDSSHLDDPAHHVLSMLYGHIVASIEGYLYATFRELVLNDDDLSMRLVNNDNTFSDRKINVTHLFGRYKDDTHRKLIDEYLQDVLFHKIERVSFMYKKVLEVDFGKVEWLYRAVEMRHDCVHRAGFDKEGDKVELDKSTISELIEQSSIFIEVIERKVSPYRANSSEEEF